jgi:cyclic-di-AMP phosphodiesterase PgpH
MLAQREATTQFTRRDAGRFIAAALLLVVALAAILGVDFEPAALQVEIGRPATEDVRAPRAAEYESEILTQAEQERARGAVPPQYDYSAEQGAAIAAEQLRAFEQSVAPIDAAFAPTVAPEDRVTLLEQALPGLTSTVRATLVSLEPDRWVTVRAEAARVLDALLRTELRDTQVASVRDRLPGRMAGDLSEDERELAAALIRSFVVANSSYSPEATERERERAAEAVEPVIQSWERNESIVRAGDRVDLIAYEAVQHFGLTEGGTDMAQLAGWVILAILVIGMFLVWTWRFRREFWHRNNVLLLLSLLLLFGTFALKITAGRAWLPYILPMAAVGMLVTVLLDAGVALMIMALLAILAGVISGGSLELAAYVFFGGLAGIVAVRKGDRLGVFVQAGIAVFIVNALVVATFALLGERDIQGVLELWAASAVSGGGAAVATVGSFAVLGSLFGILTVFQLLELANPSQPLLRRLLVETPGTYHHSLMVGNLAERAAEAIGADPLLTRVAAYYHDIGKLSNPGGFIENQAGGQNIHDQLTPEQSAQLLKQHVADGIDIAYKHGLPKPLIAFIPQHHGTGLISFFYHRAKELVAAPHGGLETAEGRKAADAVDVRKFRHAGPKPQSREAAIIMLADSVEAAVRSLASRDEPAIRAMVARIFEERISADQFDECDLTLRDIERIREAFVSQLLGMYHQRIAYPQNKIVELESRRAAGGGDGA